MAETRFWQLPETEVPEALARLAWLASVAELEDPPWLEVVPSAFGLQLILLLPVVPVYEEVAARCAQELGRVLRQGPAGGQAMPLAPACSMLVHHLAGDRSLDETIPAHHLVISDSGDREALGQWFTLLRDHATAVRVATAENSEGERLTLFHVLDDTRRRSLFQALLASGRLDETVVLQGFVLGNLQLFVGRNQRLLDTAVMQQLVYLCAQKPAWFGFRREIRREGLFAAFDDGLTGGGDGQIDPVWRFWPLSDLDFTGHEQLETKQSASQMGYQQVSLNNSRAAMLELADTLQAQAEEAGRRLSLRTMPVVEESGFERRALRERIAELEYRLAFLDRAETPQPWLWRFDQSRLPLLAEILRGLPSQLLVDGPLRYGFFADEFQPGGYHYLLVPGDQMLLEDDVLYRVLHEEGEGCAFQLDPYWARYYGETTGECAVYVPRGQALFPPLHQWEPNNNAAFFRHMVTRWFADEGPRVSIPTMPLYLFEADPFHPERLRLQVLDNEAFVPLRTRLGWLNTNLSIARHVDQQDWPAALGDQARRTDLNRAMEQRLAEAEQAFDEEARRLGRTVSAQVQDLFALLTRESQSVMEEAWRTADELSRLKQGLTRLTHVKKDMDEMLEEAEDHLRETEQQSSALSRELQVLETKLKQAMRARRRMSDEVMDEVRALQELHDDLKMRFAKMLKPGQDP
ncbi:hypothetical protein [Acanthopleuribacter pedis]|uniref:Uncharacterized protein n=1 Tax=Acanthopleuribacter pedis TaxID=442870 RepID=A0A8J7U633_9BACT|nr:hypothetical protein [Acanthopleuribacter pedis]MBO1319926.1 hypothetical protein [Acanthopleuribacter pedis]